MKKKIYRMMVLLTTVLLFAVSCGKKDEVNGGSNLSEAQSKKGTASEDKGSWRFSHAALEERYELATVKEDKIYGCYYTGEGLAVSVQDMEAGAYKNGFGIWESYVIPGVTEIQNMTVDSQNRICLFGVAETGNTLWQVEQNGEIHVIENIELEDLGEFVSPKGFWADSKGHYYLWYGMSVPWSEAYERETKEGGTWESETGDGESKGRIVYTSLDRIYVKDQNMHTICYEQVPDSGYNKLVSLLFDEDGIPMLLAKDEEGYYMRRVRTEKRDAYEPQRIEEPDENGSLSDHGQGALYGLEMGGNLALTKQGLLYTRDGALYLYHTEDGKEEKLLELAGGGILEDDIIYLGMRGESIDIIDNYQGSKGSEYTRAEIGESTQARVSLGVMQLQPKMQEAIAAFNRYQDEVWIEPVVYVEGYDYDEGYEKLKLELLQGKAPDIIATEGIDYEVLANAGAFMDLYGFMDEDTEGNRERFVSSVLKAYEVDGKLYTAAPNFFIYSMWGGSSLVQERSGVDMEELMRILHEKGGSVNSIYGFGGDESVLRTLCTLGMDEFVDWDKDTCDFTGEGFCELLEFVKEYREPQFDSLYKAIREREILLSEGMIGSVEEYCLQSELYGERVEFIGYPSAKGSGVAASMNGMLAINAKSGNPQEAWKFVKFYLLHGYDYDRVGFPLMRERLEEVFTEAMEERQEPGEDGVTERGAKISYREKDIVDLVIFKAEKEDVEAVRNLVERVTGKFEYNNEIQNIIDEEAESFFRGQKSLGQVTEVIQNRVQLYLNER
ncbi:MAG: extracellular solute-binding protein [Lachnospiraceae bacterium]|nr:extracellular solute-binding protein [Lachnospiraceae bacterium]